MYSDSTIELIILKPKELSRNSVQILFQKEE